MSLYSRLAITLFVLLALFGLFIVHMMRVSNEMYQQEMAQKMNRDLAAYIVKEQPLIDNGAINHEALEHLFHMLMVINPSIEVYLLDTSGHVIGHAAPDQSILQRRVDLAPLEKFISGDPVFPLTGEDPRDISKSRVFSAARIPVEGDLQGYLYVILGGEKYAGMTELLRGSFIFRTNSLVLLAALVIALLAGLFTFAVLTRRLRQLTQDIRAYSDRARPVLSPHAERNTGGNEIEQLERTFRDMSARIDKQVQELQQTDNLRRELVANISHDLRTPLTTLQGYLETLSLKGPGLSGEDRQQYLQTALRHCTRLTGLVDELFELARLDSCERISYSEPFSLSDLVQDIVQKYRLKASERGIELNSRSGDAAPMVYGDIAMLERALENLIDNALRHTGSGGQVSIDLNPEGDHVTVRVADTGCGIPADRLEHVFDRFYRAGESTYADDHHAGLGLAIVRRIVELHGSHIEVSSEEGKGTEFSFSINAAA